MKNPVYPPETEMINELIHLKKELVKTQVALSKKNEEIDRLNQRLHVAAGNLREFTYAVSHDLIEPLRMVISFMNLLKKKHGESLDEKANSYINFAIDGGKRMQLMVNDLLELSRTCRVDCHKEADCLGQIVDEAIRNLAMLIRETNAVINIETTLPTLVVNKTDMVRLFQNLLSNAIKFQNRQVQPVISIRATDMNNEWKFSIHDNGIGVPSDKCERIFEIFSRLHPLEDYKGTGIGLTTCRKIVESYNGRIWVESEDQKGSTFYFTIPK